ncbi:MAG: porphobilinogen synthase [Armatimonadetes bacterium]|nr:porphobilinogen synthase [Armatimonadota bacterium]
MGYPQIRMRRLRENKLLRKMLSESTLELRNLIYPLFVIEGEKIKEEISSMPGIFRFSLDYLIKEAKEIADAGIPAVILFGIPKIKDELGTQAYAPSGIIQKTLKKLKKEVPDLFLITDICLCEYTSHGHCGIVEGGKIKNDSTLELLAKTAMSHAQAGADMLAPSDMMDGRIKIIRKTLDQNSFENLPILSYASKFASAFYGPFREAADSTPKFGDRKSYQMNPANSKEALREVLLDIEEGADLIMVKPALAYLDIIQKIRNLIQHPLAAYNVSGEYSLVKAAAKKGWIDEKKMILEILTGIKRAGADLIITYHAKEVAKWKEKLTLF